MKIPAQRLFRLFYTAHFYEIFQLFYSFFKSLVGKDVVVELKNDLRWDVCFLSLFSSNE